MMQAIVSGGSLQNVQSVEEFALLIKKPNERSLYVDDITVDISMLKLNDKVRIRSSNEQTNERTMCV
jgi:hypothetical protein